MRLWEEALDLAGLNSLGVTSPALSPDWTDPVVNLTHDPVDRLAPSQEAVWRAPIAGFLFDGKQHDRVILGDGTPRKPESRVLRLHPGAYLRLARLYRGVIEGGNDGALPLRPVPYYFLYTGATAIDVEEGEKSAGQTLGLKGGSLSVHDEQGQIIDPLAVAAVWEVLLNRYPVLKAKGLPQNPSRQVSQIANSEPNQKTVVHVIVPHGMLATTAEVQQLTNLKSLDAQRGFYTVTTPSSQIAFASGSPPDLTFGLATTGKMGALTLPGPAATGLKRDFFRLLLVDRKRFLLGLPIAQFVPTDPASAVEPELEIRHNQHVSFLLSGSAALGSASALLTNDRDVSLVVAPEIAQFAVPRDGGHAEWPSYPESPTGSAGDAPITNSLRDKLQLSATFLTPSEDAWNDVLLKVDGIPEQCAVRVYPRVFKGGDSGDSKAGEGRGDGVGAVQIKTSTMEVRLPDPLGLKKTPFDRESKYTLHVDLIVVNRKNEARLFGNLTCLVSEPEPEPEATPMNNLFETAAMRSVSPAGLLGFEPKPPNSLESLDGGGLLLMKPEEGGPPTVALRWPTMSRRESIVASFNGNQWSAQLSGLHILQDGLNSKQKLGSPGCPGGRELDAVAVEASGGLLAYDLARAALRRCLGAKARLALMDTASAWDPPPPNSPAAGSISAVVLQTIPPVVESPAFSFLNLASLDDDKRIQALQLELKEVSTATNYDPTKPQKSALQREELRREYSASAYGRRDTLRALSDRIAHARDLIYIEGFSFLNTGYGSDIDLIQTLKTRLGTAPALKVILCLSKYPDFGDQFKSYTAWELDQRKKLGDGLDSNRVAAFHPLGIPGRALHLTTTLIIIDDMWALIGTSAIRRRSLTFDGSIDAVLFDTELEEGRGKSIGELRRNRLAGFLGPILRTQRRRPIQIWFG